MRHITHRATNKPFGAIFVNPVRHDMRTFGITLGDRNMMDYDDYLLSTHGIDDGDETIDGEHPDNVPSAWTHIVDFDVTHDWQMRELDLQDWLEDRATALLGEDGADHLDVRGLLAHWVNEGHVETMCGSWWFTRDVDAKVWLPRK